MNGALLIGGDKVTTSSGGTYEHLFAGTGRPNATITIAGAAEMDAAVRSAAEAQREWVSFPVDRRRDVLLDLADAVRDHQAELSELNTHDYAVPISMAGNSVLTERFLRYYAGYADKAHGLSTPVSGGFDVNLVEREPYGVIGVIAPWNGALVPVGLAVAPALAAGNAVVLKPSELAPLAALRFGELCLEVGLPAGLVNVVTAGAEGGDALVRHPGIGKIHFTGGGGTARTILRAATDNLTPVVTELGGKNALLVFDDANLDGAAMLAAFQGPLGQAGQSCACASRIIVHHEVYDAFLEKFVAVVQSAPIGDPFDPQVMFGPVVTQGAADRILGVIDEAVDRKMGRLVTGGSRLGGDLADGYFIEPTVFADVDNASPLAAIETFGPVVSVLRATDEDDAVRIANDTTYGLNAFIQTNDLTRAHRVARRLESGSVWVNTFSDIQPQGPYGGYKQSGTGRAGGVEGLHEFLRIKNVRIGMG
ncbi:aldehyde dehydrogenase family protein [Cryptosporangium aurantiacum]|uniref:Acyl-CoA reductase n=1 Tax=Cryptosporangium aurantiacum TaxID=134849 RepID=A0A1M7PCM8_9ACTN|nr:aldehyde dehydrogenase family protein [Cryptosporangium aurantiacum]SHN14640.1 Acyl-CoA reductase [Cryptosporangium aurantiacum]